ncbi:MAG TPA: hypothetical protein PKD83_09885 [Ignavibacteria bacterium]|nr:hypothetical protein [Ignavibacteria bacterium]
MTSVNKNKNRLISFLIIIVVAFLIFLFKSLLTNNKSVIESSDTPGKKVSLVISPEFVSFFKEQDVWMKVTVMNNSPNDYYLKFPLNRSLINLSVTTPAGKIIKDSVLSEITEPSDSLKLLPGSSYEKVMPMNREIKNSSAKGNFILSDTGIYKIKIFYQDLISDEISIPVTAPSGNDKELYDKPSGSLFEQNVSEYDKLAELEELLKKYPASKYSPQLYYLFFRESNFTNDYNRSSENISDFFKYNNNTYGAELILDLGNHNMEKLSSMYRDTKTGYLIRQRRKEIMTHK